MTRSKDFSRPGLHYVTKLTASKRYYLSLKKGETYGDADGRRSVGLVSRFIEHKNVASM